MFDVTVPSPTMTAIRDALKGIGGLLVGVGIVSEADWSTWTGALLFIVPAGYALWKQFKMRERLQ